MKVFYLITLAWLLSLAESNAQAEFGLKGGLNITFFKVSEANFGTNPDTEVGFYGGFFADFDIKNDFHLQPELLFIGVRDFKFLNAPIYVVYDINEDFHVLVGPSLNYFFDFFANRFKVRADLGLGYDFSSRLGLHMKYTIGFEELSPNIVFLGINYKI